MVRLAILKFPNGLRERGIPLQKGDAILLRVGAVVGKRPRAGDVDTMASKPGLTMATLSAVRLTKVTPSSNNVASPAAMVSKTNCPDDDSGVNST